MATTRSVSVELLGNYKVGTTNGVSGTGSNPAVVGLGDGGFATAIDDSSLSGINVQFSSANGTPITRIGFAGSDPSIALHDPNSGLVGVVGTTPSGQIVLTQLDGGFTFNQRTIGAGSNADIATDKLGIPGYGVVWERSDGVIALAIAASNDATSLTQVVVASSSLQVAHDPSVARLANGNYVVAWSQYGSAAIDTTYFAIFAPDGSVVRPITFVGSSDVPSGSETARIVHPSVAAHGNDFTISFENIDYTGEFEIAQYTRSDDGRNIAFRYYDAPPGSQDITPDTATVGSLHVTAFTSNYLDGEDFRGQDLNLGISEPGTGTILTDADNLVRITADGQQASVAAIRAGDTGRFVVSYYDAYGGEVRQQLAQVRETITGDASNQSLQGKYDVAVSIDGGGGNDHLFDGDGDDKLFGNTGNDVLHSRDSEYGAYSGNDLFDGGDGVDTLDFGDFFGSIVASLVVTGPQNTGAGMDTILRIENLTGSGFGADRLAGTSGSNVLDDGGPNRYSSAILKDTLIGGLGDDTYVVSDSVDIVTESSASGGIDLVKSRAASFTLPTNVENLLLLAEAGSGGGTGNGLANTLTGNALANSLSGGGGNDTISGSRGNDTIDGGEGTDHLSGGAGADRLIGGDGRDYARYDDAAWGNIVIRLDGGAGTGAAAGDSYSSIEGVIGGNGNDTIYGSVGDNHLIGGFGNDFFSGNTGNDTIEGGPGADRIRFSTAPSATNVDTLVGFQHDVDKIELSRSIFTSIGPTLTADEFGPAADPNNFIIYQQSTGRLLYDAGGSGGGAGPTLFAVVAAGTVLDVGDFTMV